MICILASAEAMCRRSVVSDELGNGFSRFSIGIARPKKRRRRIGAKEKANIARFSRYGYSGGR